MANMIKSISIVCSVFCASVALGQTEFTPISNLNQPSSGDYLAVDNTQTVAESFTTGNTATHLAKVSVLLANPSGSGQHFQLSLYSDVNGSPGSSLVPLLGNPAPISAGIYSYTNTSPLILSAETTYWIVASSSDAAFNASIWYAITSAGLDAGSTWTTGISKSYNGVGWNAPGLYQQFNITVTHPIPPAISIFQPVVLTFPANGFPFVLQQSTSLTSSNWIPATNAIQMATVNTNQTVFMVPSSSQQMFFRLSVQ